MKLTTSTVGGATVVALSGNLMGGPDGTTLNTKLHELIDDGTRYVVLDLSGVQFLNSSGLSLLIAGASALRNAGGALKLARVSAKVSAVITLAKLTSVLEMHESVEAAAASFKR